jgi:hypothetical protein
MRIQRIATGFTALNLVILLATFTQARVIGAQNPNPVLRGRALELVDEDGRMRARLNVESDGQVVFRLLDQRGTIRVKLGASEDGSGLVLANDATEPGVHILAKADGSSLRLANKDGRERVITP